MIRLCFGLRFAFQHCRVIVSGRLKYMIVANESGQSLEVHLCYRGRVRVSRGKSQVREGVALMLSELELPLT